jgi:hypothetical protein
MSTRLIVISAKYLAAACLALVVFWQVAQHAGPRRGTAIVHVSQPDTIVIIDDQRYRVESLTDSPVVCELEPGIHVAQVRRDGRVLGSESFKVESGTDVVIYPFSRPALATEAVENQPMPKVMSPTGLAIHARRPAPGQN